jgi:hypothetical protein
MNRDHQGKALHHYLSTSPLLFAIRNGAAQTSWDRLPEDIQEAYRTVGEALAQDFIYGGKYELSLSSLSEHQIIYNGLLSYVSGVDHMGNGWCHLLLLRSKRDDFEDEEATPKLAILAQLPGRLFAIQRQIEGLATFVMDFFKYSYFNHPSSGDVTIIPDNTTFVLSDDYSCRRMRITKPTTITPSMAAQSVPCRTLMSRSLRFCLDIRALAW